MLSDNNRNREVLAQFVQQVPYCGNSSQRGNDRHDPYSCSACFGRVPFSTRLRTGFICEAALRGPEREAVR